MSRRPVACGSLRCRRPSERLPSLVRGGAEGPAASATRRGAWRRHKGSSAAPPSAICLELQIRDCSRLNDRMPARRAEPAREVGRDAIGSDGGAPILTTILTRTPAFDDNARRRNTGSSDSRRGRTGPLLQTSEQRVGGSNPSSRTTTLRTWFAALASAPPVLLVSRLALSEAPPYHGWMSEYSLV
jgi:hypothetical protein